MFVFSLRANKPKKIILLCCIIFLLILGVLGIKGRNNTVSKLEGISLKASTSDERIAFLSQYGWKINSDPVEVTEIIIPSEFNDTYASYNEIQKTQGLNLETYKGRRVKKWVYQVKNYPGYSEDCECIQATLLIYEGLVIGGDVSSLEQNGFMQGFEYPDEQLSATTTR